MTRVSIINDTSRFHFGSAAVMDHIFATVTRLGWEINASFFGNSFMYEKREPPIDEALIEQSDIIIINGEGSIHHDWPMAVFLMDFIERHKHKKICLANTMWQAMSPASAAKLQHAQLVIARDPESHREISTFYKGTLHLAPDFSSRVNPPLSPMDDHGIVYGGFYWNQHAKVAGLEGKDLALKALAEKSTIDITRENWHITVSKLRSSRLLVTGKFHEVMAAIVARCPFLFCPVSTHKIEILGEFGGGERLKPLDMRLSRQQYLDAFDRAISDKAHYDRIFDAVLGASRAFDLEAALKELAAR